MLQQIDVPQPAEYPRGRARRTLRWRLATSAPGELRIVFLRSVLRYDEVRLLFDWLLNERRRFWRTITFDLTNVRDVVAPWAPVFAHLAYVALRTRVDCQLVGLNARLTAMASCAADSVAPGTLRLSAEAAGVLREDRDWCNAK